jgi:hypothetical protein
VTYDNSGNAFGGDRDPATAAQLTAPLSLALDGSGNIYFTDAPGITGFGFCRPERSKL